jgi:two-component system NtrC family sensor kinase
MKPKFSIRYKFLAVTTALLVVCVGAYLALATKEFKNDKRALVFDYNQSLVVNTASDLESFFGGLADKMRVLAFFYREPQAKRQLLIADLMRDKQDLVFVAGSDHFKGLDEVFYQDQEFIKTYGLQDKWYVDLISLRPIPFEKIQMEGEAIWNATSPDGASLIGFAKSVVEEDARGVPVQQFAVIGFVRADRLLKALEQGRPNEVYIVGADGQILAHPDPLVMSAAAARSDRLVEIAVKDSVKKKVTEFVEGESRYLAAYAKTLGDRVLVLSKISEARAFRAVNRLVIRSLLFASMVVTLAFLVAIFFSRSLTRPLDTLMKGMGRVSEGDLTGQIQVQSRDEIASLAASFNLMIRDLNQSRTELEEINRDLEEKVKSRTRELELQNRAVKEAQETLLRTTRLAAIGEVAGVTAHEVLNPLTSILSRLNKVKDRVAHDRAHEAQLLIDLNSDWSRDYTEGGFQKLMKVWSKPSSLKPETSLWDEDLENLKNIGRNVQQEFVNLSQDTDFLIQEVERISRIVNSFRSLSTPKGDLKPCHVKEMCEKSMHIMADLANRDSIEFRSQWASAEDLVLIDDDEFVQVMTNLLRNALQSVKAKYAGAKGGWVELRTAQNGDEIEITIADNGQGVAPEFRARLFEKNFTTKSKSQGTGIGLSISRRLIRAFKGDLRLLETTAQSGAQFVVTLPRHQAEANRGVA